MKKKWILTAAITVVVTGVIICGTAIYNGKSANAGEGKASANIVDGRDFTVNQENRPFDVNFDENDELKASVKYSVTIDGEKNYFFPTMDDPQAALAWLKKAAPNVLQALSEEYDLDEITCDNWEQYRDSLFVLLDKDGAPDWYHEEEGYEEFMKVEGLFDILENDVLNEELLEYLDSIEGSLTVEDKEALAVHFLPYTAPLSEKRTGPMTFEE